MSNTAAASAAYLGHTGPVIALYLPPDATTAFRCQQTLLSRFGASQRQEEHYEPFFTSTLAQRYMVLDRLPAVPAAI